MRKRDAPYATQWGIQPLPVESQAKGSSPTHVAAASPSSPSNRRPCGGNSGCIVRNDGCRASAWDGPLHFLTAGFRALAASALPGALCRDEVGADNTVESHSCLWNVGATHQAAVRADNSFGWQQAGYGRGAARGAPRRPALGTSYRAMSARAAAACHLGLRRGDVEVRQPMNQEGGHPASRHDVSRRRSGGEGCGRRASDRTLAREAAGCILADAWGNNPNSA